VFGDTVGAGDSLMAGILTYLAEHKALEPGRIGRLDDVDLAAMLGFGAVVAGLNCAHKGCVPPTREEVEAVLVQPGRLRRGAGVCSPRGVCAKVGTTFGGGKGGA
jgi:fructokinase